MVTNVNHSHGATCCQCGRLITSPSACLPIDDENAVCDDCYRKMLAPDHNTTPTEHFD